MKELTYSNRNGYLIPNLEMDNNPEEPETLTQFGRARQRYLKDHRRGTYTAMLLKGTLWSHLTETDRRANQQMEDLVKSLAASEGVNEALKAANQMEWVRRMNNIRQRAEEIVNAELIYN